MIDKSLLTGSTSMLILKLIEERDMYGYEMIEELLKRSDNTFELKAGTLYPLLHLLAEQGVIKTYDGAAENGRIRKYYGITDEGRKLLSKKQEEWETFSFAVNKVLKGGVIFAAV
jgi:PadR family transcriptional regulator PadR